LEDKVLSRVFKIKLEGVSELEELILSISSSRVEELEKYENKLEKIINERNPQLQEKSMRLI
jgi:hypothetical protein